MRSEYHPWGSGRQNLTKPFPKHPNAKDAEMAATSRPGIGGSNRSKSPCGGHSRRSFLQRSLAVASGVSLGGLAAGYSPLWADDLRRRGKRVLLIWLAGGSSQLETFDPKPRRPTGGPFLAIPTAVPGVQLCELMPKTAALMDRIAIVRSLDTRVGAHAQAAELIDTGRGREPGLVYPDWGTVISKELSQRDSRVPDYVSLYLATEGHRSPNPGFLGGSYTAMHLRDGLKPANITPPEGLDHNRHIAREHLREYLTAEFQRSRPSEPVRGYNSAYARVRGLMASDALFDLEQEPAQIRDRYGSTEFGQQALVARRLLEAGVPMVKVARAWWDSHHDNFESHRELVTEFDHVYSVLLADLADRGLLDDTLVVTLSEFGRTPTINKNVGRDHFASAWSFSLAGYGVRGGTVHGKTDPDGKEVIDGKAGPGDILATIYQAMGIDPHQYYVVGARPVPLAPEGSQPITTVLA